MSSTALHVDRVSSGYGSSLVLRSTSVRVGLGEAVAVLGKNGMGKSTLLKSIMGYLPKSAGTVVIGEEDVTHAPPHRVSRLGVSYAAQERALFTELSIRDNLRLGLASDAAFDARFQQIAALFPMFETRLSQYAGTLSGGEQKMLLVARTLMARPSIVLLDEITEGVQPSIVERIAQALLWERQQRRTTMLIVEQNVPFALRVADRFVVLKQGEIVDEGDTKWLSAADSIYRHLRV